MPQLTRTMAPVEPEWVDPYAQQRAALAARMQQEQAPMYSPEEIAQRRNQNQAEYEIGLASMLSGNQAIGNLGGNVLKNALANRQARVNERGSADPLTGKFTYSPDYLNAQQQAQMDKLDAGSAASHAEFRKGRQSHQDKIEEKRNQYELMRQFGIGTGGGSNAGLGVGGGAAPFAAGPNEEMVFRDKAGRPFVYENGKPVPYTGDLLPKPASGTATEGERKAATLLKRLEFSEKQLMDAIGDDKEAAKPGVFTEGVRHFPLVGEWAANAATTPERQRVEGAQLDLLDAALTLGTGASYTREQLLGYAKSYFPQIGDDDKAVKDKQARLTNVIEAGRIAAGRAAPASAPKQTAPKPAAPTAPAGNQQPVSMTPEMRAELEALKARFRPGGTK